MTDTTSEITIKELYIQLKEAVNFLLTQWKIILLVGLLSGILGFTYAFFQKKKFIGELTFALEEKSSSMGSYAAIASQFGLDLGGGSNGGAFAGDNLVELIKTRLMIEKTLINPVIIAGDTELLINRFIEYNNLHETWQDKAELQHIKFEVGVPRSAYTLIQDSILNQIQLHVKKNMLSVKRIDKKLNMVSVVCVSEDELFAKYFTQELVGNTSSFYIDSKTKKAKKNIAILENKIDSVKATLDNRLYGAAIFQDQNTNGIRAQVKVPFAKQQIDIQLLTVVYAELSKNIELSKFSLMREEPLVQIIDAPILPLKVEKVGKLFSMLIWGLMGGILIIIYLLAKKKVDKIKNNG